MQWPSDWRPERSAQSRTISGRPLDSEGLLRVPDFDESQTKLIKIVKCIEKEKSSKKLAKLFKAIKNNCSLFKVANLPACLPTGEKRKRKMNFKSNSSVCTFLRVRSRFPSD